MDVSFPIKPIVKSLKRTYEIGEACYTIVPNPKDWGESRRVSCVVRYKFKPEHHSYESYVLEVIEPGAHYEIVVRDALRIQPLKDENMLFADQQAYKDDIPDS